MPSFSGLQSLHHSRNILKRALQMFQLVLAYNIKDIINAWYHAFIDNSPCDVYFAAVFLHPSESLSSSSWILLRLPDFHRVQNLWHPQETSEHVLYCYCPRQTLCGWKFSHRWPTGTPFPRAHAQVKEYLKKWLLVELEANIRPLIKELGGRMINKLLMQLFAYAHGCYPLDIELVDEFARMVD